MSHATLASRHTLGNLTTSAPCAPLQLSLATAQVLDLSSSSVVDACGERFPGTSITTSIRSRCTVLAVAEAVSNGQIAERIRAQGIQLLVTWYHT